MGAQQRADLVTQLTDEKAGLERQTADLQKKLAGLKTVENELVQKKQQADSSAVLRLAAGEARWLAGSCRATAPSPWQRNWRRPEARRSGGRGLAQTGAAQAREGSDPGHRHAEELRRRGIGSHSGRQLQRGARDGEGSDDEKPRHEVQISRDFYVGKFEVTQGIYTKVMGVNPSWFSSTGSGSDKVRGMDTSDFPVENVSWFDTIEFCNKLSLLEKLPPYYELANVQRSGETITSATVKILGGDGYRLLTEAEWEYVARASGPRSSPGATRWPRPRPTSTAIIPTEMAPKGPNLERTAKVGSYQPNAWGLDDTTGNVWEWVWDWYGENEYRQSGRRPQWTPPACQRRIPGHPWRGWYGGGEGCRPAVRDWFAPGGRFSFLGFRVARGLSSR